jgi:putative ATP-binding cassette transporter
MLHKPRWVVIDRALDALDDDAHTLVIGLFNDELKDAVIINIGRPETERKHFFTRVLRSDQRSEGTLLPAQPQGRFRWTDDGRSQSIVSDE